MAAKITKIPVKKVAVRNDIEGIEEPGQIVVVKEDEIEESENVEVVRNVEVMLPQAVTDEYEPHHLYSLKLTDLNPDPDQPRKHFDDNKLNELASSIRRLGVIQPIFFRKAGDGKLMIMAGERRFRASKLAGKDTIPAIYLDGTNYAEIALIENLQRADLTAIEEAEALYRLKTEASYTNADLAAVLGKAESTISETLKLIQLPEKLRKKHGGNHNLSKRALLEVTKATTLEQMEKLFKKALKKELKRDEVRAERNDSKDAGGATRGPDVVCRTMSGGLLKALDKLDLESIAEDKRAAVEDSLTDTLKKLAKVLGYQLDKQ
ncbi:MAG: hypothetical protein A2075_23860 [Geobacteraceae bacterium GWC2_58_44]|nr:MAG: hypothetical protein A2075_23860 [Geobacteraceae bacterium GWC2_58_44]